MSEAYALESELTEAPEDEAPGFDLMAAVNSPNIAAELDDSTLNAIGAKVVEEFKIDEESRKTAGYEERVERAVKLASLVNEAKNYPWPGASNIKYPLIIQAAIQFNARSYPAVVDGPQVVKGSTQGKPDPQKDARGERVGKHMSWQLLEEEEEWEEDTDSLLLRLPIVGTLYRKRYFDPQLGRNCSHVLGPDEFVVNYKAKRDLSVIPRATHILSFYPHEIIEKKRSGLWLDVELGEPQDAANDDQAPRVFLEQERLWDLDDDGYPEPYIVTVHKDSEKVVRIVARFHTDGIEVNEQGEILRIKPYEIYTKYGFIPSADGSHYDMGYGTLLGPVSDTINSTINQLMDAAHLSNVQGGFIGAGVSIKSGNQSFRPGEWRKAESVGGSLRDNIVPLPTKEPSSVLYNLMVFLIETSKDLTATQDILTGDAGKGTMPVGTVQALVEQGLKTFTAIVKRIHRSFKRELRIMYQLNARYLKPEVYFQFQDEPSEVLREDYTEGDLNVVPVSDPNMATDMQRMSQAQFTVEIGKQTGAIPPRKLAEVALKAARVPDIEGLLGPETPPAPDPKMLEVEADAKLREREIDIKDRVAASDIALKDAQTAKAKAELAMIAPQFLAQMENLVRSAVQQALAMVENGGKPETGPEGPGGMVGGPPDGGVPPMVEGPVPDALGPMGPGPGDGGGPAGEGAPVQGAVDDQLAGPPEGL